MLFRAYGQSFLASSASYTPMVISSGLELECDAPLFQVAEGDLELSAIDHKLECEALNFQIVFSSFSHCKQSPPRRCSKSHRCLYNE